MNDYYFEGDPAVDSTRRHLERVLEGRPTRRWPWIVAALAGGTAFTLWRVRAHRAKSSEAAKDAKPEPARNVQHDAKDAKPEPVRSVQHG